MRCPWLHFLGVVLLAVASVGCGAASAPTALPTPSFTPTQPVSPTASEPLITVLPNPEGPGALMAGRLSLEGGCLHAVDVDSGARWLLVFPATARWDHEEQAVHVEDLVLKVGEVAYFGGGAYELTPMTAARIEWVRPPPRDCLPASAWLVHTVDREIPR